MFSCTNHGSQTEGHLAKPPILIYVGSVWSYDRVVFRFFGLGNLEKYLLFIFAVLQKLLSYIFVFHILHWHCKKVAFFKMYQVLMKICFFSRNSFHTNDQFSLRLSNNFPVFKTVNFSCRTERGFNCVPSKFQRHKLIRRVFSKLMKVTDVYLSLVQTGVSSWLNVYSIHFCGLKIEGICCNMVVNGDLTVVFNFYLNGMKPKTLNFYSYFVSTKLFHLTSDQPSSKMRQALKRFLCKRYQNCFDFWV